MSLFRSSVLLLTVAPASVFAQTVPPDHDPVALENVVVTAHPYGRLQADLAQPTSVLSGRQLALRQAGSLGETLAGEPGVASTYFGPGASRPVIRGFGGDRIRVLENNLATFDASIISPDHAVGLDPLLVERVEIVRGPATLLHGSSAVGGVVNVIHHRIHQTLPDRPLNGRLEARAASVNDETSGGIVLEGAHGAVAWHLDGFRRDSDDVRIPGYAASAARRALEDHEEHGDHDSAEDHEDEEPAFGRIPNTAVRADGGSAGLSWIGDAGFVGFSYSGFNTLYGIPPGGHTHAHDEPEDGDHADDEHADEPLDHAHEDSIRIDLKQRRIDLQAALTQPIGIFHETRLNLARTDYRHIELEGDDIGTTFTHRGHEGRLELLHEDTGPLSGALGLQATRSDFAAVGEEAFVPPSRTDRRAVFVFEELETSPLTWQLGARWERQEIDVRDGSGRGHRGDATNLSAGAVWNLTSAWTLAASLTRSERQPNSQELFADGPHLGTLAYEIGDPALGRETSAGLDLTLRRRTGRVTGSVGGFYHRFDGYIYEQPTGEVRDELEVYRFVQSDALFYGGEVEALLHVHEGAAHRFDVTLAADFVRATDRDTNAPLPRITPLRYRAGLAWASGGWSAGGDVQWVREQTRIAPFETATDGHVLASAYLGYRWLAGHVTYDLFLRGTNLGHEEARVHTSFLKDVAPLPGRNVLVGVRASF